MDAFQGVVLTLSFTDSLHDFVEGSAVLVAPGIALSAWHVLKPRLEAIMAGEITAQCLGVASDGVRLWQVRKVTHVPETDVVILGLSLRSDVSSGTTLYQAHLTTRFPKIGERLTLYGFRAAAEALPRDGDGGSAIAGQLLCCAGEVSQVFPTGRDRVMLPWPTVEVSGPSWGGMSGGPVVDDSGMLIGLLSSSVTAEAGPGPSYVSHLWPVLTASFGGGWPESLFTNSTTLLEMDSSLCGIEGRDALRFNTDPVTGRVTTQYRPWYERPAPQSGGA
ncbi:MAG: hypothetical protein A3G24_26305 [Betaproteobacteria bacterium RIFCSPLOWO2_12_FULL_62_13]|nr:MAG: hypothetical protein A3G24_26305 [Betaproteobacteria bacterium RIFCSPLOWO2_12_FULL_62_13]